MIYFEIYILFVQRYTRSLLICLNQLELAKAQIMHESCRKMVAEAQIKAKDALLQVQAAEIARLRRIVCDTSP